MSLNKTGNRIIAVFGIILILGTFSIPSAYALEIIIDENAEVRGDTVLLGDIADFIPADDKRIPDLMGLEISASPSPGEDFRLNERFLINKISSSISDDADIRAKIPSNLTITRSAQYITPAQFEDIFRNHILEKSPWPSDKITFDRITTPGNVSLPEGKFRWIVQEKSNTDYIGNISLSLGLWVNDREIRRVPVSGRISITGEAVQAARGIKTGDIITRDDLALVTENNIRFQKDAVTDLTDAIGKRSARQIQAGQVITASMIENPPMIKKGNSVLIKAESPEVLITAHGKVLEDGCMGDQIRVVNISSGKEISAVVTGPGLVEVTF
jgi:flagella basal body P-ring formation protein FlgA